MPGSFEPFNPSYQPKIFLINMKPGNDKIVIVTRNGAFYSSGFKTKPSQTFFNKA